MPAENARLFRRVARRDRWFVAVVAGACLVATPAALVLADSNAPGAGPRPGCISAIVPGFMGGETHVFCGAEARTFCESEVAARNGEVVAACREQVLAADSSQP